MPLSADMDKKILAVAKRQNGFIRWSQLVAIGVTSHGLQSRMRRGLLRRVSHGLYQIPMVGQDSWVNRAQTACMAAGQGAVLSHDSAARVLELELPKRDRIEVTVPYERKVHRRMNGVVVHYARHLPGTHRVHVSELVVTSAMRTLLDVAPRYGAAQLHNALDAAVMRKLIHPRKFAALLSDPHMKSRPGSRALREGIGGWLEHPRLESVWEMRLYRVLVSAGLRPPVSQFDIFERGKRIACADFAWPELKVAVEMDGVRHHSTPRALAHDQRRDHRLGALGWIVLRITPEVLRSDPGPFLESLRLVLLSRAA